MKEFEKICEIIVTPPNKEKMVYEVLEKLDVSVIETAWDKDGKHLIIMKERDKRTVINN